MEIDKLKLIIEALNNLGGGAKEAFYWWLIINYGLAYLIGIIWSIIGGFVAWRGIKLAENAFIANSQLTRLMNAFGTAYYFSSTELEKAEEALRKVKNERR